MNKERLHVLYSYGWRCILMSKQLTKHRVSTHCRVVASDERVEYNKHMLCTLCVHRSKTRPTLTNLTQNRDVSCTVGN
jgi:hypothetical protein